MKILYTLKNVTDLEWALTIAEEVKAEVGLTPDYIETDRGERVTYDRTDFRRLEKGDIGDSDYIDRHRFLADK
ncbi:MAG: hypothetical protein IJZ42_00885 [Lachnospiraceae bacterium]|nr:hypothetical protein [Lachnospiraceae bacterium]